MKSLCSVEVTQNLVFTKMFNAEIKLTSVFASGIRSRYVS